MTVTIVSSPPQSTQAATVDKSVDGDSTTAGTDFARLLLGQLRPSVPQVALPETKADPASTSPDDTPVDAASILATLIPPSEPGRRIDDASDSRSDRDTTLPLSALSGRSTADLPTAQQTTDKTILKTQPEANLNPEPALSDDKAAKFAATVSLASADNSHPSSKSSQDEVSLPLSSLTGPNTLSHANHIPANRDASLTINTSFRDQNWGTDFGQKVVWLVNSDKQSAQLTLNPPQMGPIDISITVDKGHATASFASANSDVREAIETALPRLREMFASAGIQLGQTNVGAESFQQQAANNSANYGSSRWMSDNAILGADSAGSLPVRAFVAQQGNGMVDIFA
jgi:flagellar hook-length control protein FliK